MKIKYLTELEEVEGGNLIYMRIEKRNNYIIGRDSYLHYRERLGGRANSAWLWDWGMKRSNDSECL